MTGTETAFLGVIIGLVGFGGGVWAGARGKVREADCMSRHAGLSEDRKEIREVIEKGFREIKDTIEKQICKLQDEDKDIYRKLDGHETRISMMEGHK